MTELAKKIMTSLKRVTWARPAGVVSAGEDYKVEILDENIGQDEHPALYFHEEYVDNIAVVRTVPEYALRHNFKLQKVAGAWRATAKTKLLQRIYSAAWGDKKQLAVYLQRPKKPAKRDHRKIGSSLTCIICRKKRGAWRSGITTAGQFSVSWKCSSV